MRQKNSFEEKNNNICEKRWRIFDLAISGNYFMRVYLFPEQVAKKRVITARNDRIKNLPSCFKNIIVFLFRKVFENGKFTSTVIAWTTVKLF